MGSIDFSLEQSPIGKYWQPHWHLALHTHDPELLRENLMALFPPVHKIIKIELLRTGRTHLPELLLALDRINPLDPMVFHGLVLSVQDNGFNFEITV